VQPFDIDNDLLGIIWTSHFERRFDDRKDGNMKYDDFHIVEYTKGLVPTVNQKDGEWLLWMDNDDEKNKNKQQKRQRKKRNKYVQFILEPGYKYVATLSIY
jgi:hypothetical protein